MVWMLSEQVQMAMATNNAIFFKVTWFYVVGVTCWFPTNMKDSCWKPSRGIIYAILGCGRASTMRPLFFYYVIVIIDYELQMLCYDCILHHCFINKIFHNTLGIYSYYNWKWSLHYATQKWSIQIIVAAGTSISSNNIKVGALRSKPFGMIHAIEQHNC